MANLVGQGGLAYLKSPRNSLGAATGGSARAEVPATGRCRLTHSQFIR